MKYFFWGVLALVFINNKSFAQENIKVSLDSVSKSISKPFINERLELSLKDAIIYALQNKADATKAKLQIENAEYKIEETKAQLLPQISGSGNITNNPLLQKSAIPGEIIGQPGTTILATFGQKWNASIGAHLSQNIFNQSIFTGLKAAKTTREFYQINAELTDEELMQKVAQNYYQVYTTKEQLKVIDSSLANTIKIKEILKGLYNNGLAKKIDLDRLDVKLSNIQTQRQKSLNAIEIQENTLKFFIGMPIEQTIIFPKLNYETVTLSNFQEELFKVEELSKYKLLNTQKQLLFLQKQSIKANYYPTLSLDANYSYQGIGDDFPIFARDNSNANWFEVASVGLNLNIPVFSGFSTHAKVKQTEIDIQSIDEDIKNLRLALHLEFTNSKAQLINSIVTINNQKKNVELAQSVLNNTENNYYNGLTSLTDLIEAQNALIESQNNLNQAILEYKLAEINLLKAKGQLTSLIK
ncbi:TolC family protein [Lutibacter aestuarii]|uniref:TolC family protein n=1 Tax=Lutibacter aestuarii TaxID=861111 RepID=A0ABW2ZA53_9FLAO